jgi:hypothetical protein
MLTKPRGNCSSLPQQRDQWVRTCQPVTASEPVFGYQAGGIGTIQGFWARSQASAIWARVARLRSAMVPKSSTRARLALRAASEKRGTMNFAYGQAMEKADAIALLRAEPPHLADPG